MEIDAKTLLLVLIIVVGSLFLVLIFNYSLFDTSDSDEISESNTVEIASTSKQNTIKKSSQESFTDNTESQEETTDEEVEETILEPDEETENEEYSESEIIADEPIEDSSFENTSNLSKIQKNNPSPTFIFNENEKYVDRGVKFSYLNASSTLAYKIPESWVSRGSNSDLNKMTEANIMDNGYFLSDFGVYDEYITYEEFLNIFMESEKAKDTFSDYVEFNIRDLPVSATENFPVVEKTSYNTVTDYMVFVRDGRVFTLEVTVSKNKRENPDIMRQVDNILKSAYLRY